MDCPNGQHCDVAANACVECVTSTQCTNMRACGPTHRCVDGCMSNGDCGRGGADFCDPATMACVDCRTNADCGGGGLCLPDHTCQ
jgi:Cys-rich repeat protein